MAYKKDPELQLPLFGTPSGRKGQDDLNLAEYPITLLSDRAPAGTQIRKQEWPGKDGNKRPVTCSWTLAAETGQSLPVASDEPVYMVLMEMTREQLNTEPVVTFSRNEVCDKLGWPHKGESFRRIEESIRRLHGVTIRARYLIRDAAGELVEEVGFHVLSDYALYDERKSANRGRSFIRWSDTMWESISAGRLKLADISFYLSLATPTSRRLWRYLDKKRFGNRRLFSIGLRVLCQNHLFMSAEKPSDMRRQLEGAHAELIERGFLEGVTYGRRKDGKDLITYEFTPLAALEARQEAVTLPSASRDAETVPSPQEDAIAAKEAAMELLDSLITPEILEQADAELDRLEVRPPRRGSRLRESMRLEQARKIVRDLDRQT